MTVEAPLISAVGVSSAIVTVGVPLITVAVVVGVPTVTGVLI